MAILAIDAGTTGVTALVVSETGQIISKGYREFIQYFPEPGQVEHEPEEIWQATLAAANQALAQTAQPISSLGITNQRETVVLWDRKSLRSPRKAIVWQDRRTSDLVEDLRDAGNEDSIRKTTGLGLDPYFSSSKLLWLARKEPAIWSDVRAGNLCVGTVDSYLIAKLTGGRHHLTDASNASRTQLLDISTGSWSDSLLDLFEVPRSALPEVVPSYGKIAQTDPEHFLNMSVPISGIAGDQQAALFGQNAFDIGESKCTFGTGAFILTNTGEQIVESRNGLLTTIAWQNPTGKITYALEGSVFVAGAAVQWFRDGLGLIKSSQEIEQLAASVPDSQGVIFVPALTGLGAPHWDSTARGSVFGLTRGTTSAHLARATLDAIAYQVRDLVLAIQSDTGVKLDSLRVDGGASANNLLMQIQSNCLQLPVVRGKNIESTGLGAAFLAGLGSGVWSDFTQLRSAYELDRIFEPQEFDATNLARWSKAIELTRKWD